MTQARAESATATETGLMRVPSERIGRLMDLVAELSLSVAETVRSPDLQGLELSHFENSVHRLMMIVHEVQDAATDMRLVAIDEVFKRLRRMGRELERQTGKKIDIVTIGAETQIDKLVADRLYDPLLHVLRNAADHGLETPEGRAAAGKPEIGRITLRASQVGSEVRIVVEDDGRGLNRAKILAKARERGFFAPDEEPEPAQLWKVIFKDGFSTADTVSNLSGRGVGMDVLNTTISDLRGRITVDSVEGRGTRVSLHIPVSLAFLDCVILRLAGRLFAAPIDVVSEILRREEGQMANISAEPGAEVYRWREGNIRVCRLTDFFTGMEPRPHNPSEMIVVFQTASGPLAVPVDEVLDRQQVVMKPLSGRLAQVRASYGCALLGSGEVALVLDCERLASGGVQ